MASRLATLGPRVLDFMKELEGGPQSLGSAGAILTEAVVREMLRNLLDEISGMSGGIKGFFRDPFEPLLELGEGVFPALLAIARNPFLGVGLRGMAVRALGEYDSPRAIPTLREIHDRRRALAEAEREADPEPFEVDDTLYRATRYILYRLGEREPFLWRILELNRQKDEALRSSDEMRYFDLRWQICYEWHQVKEYDHAVALYENLLEMLRRFELDGLSIGRISYYNLACIHSLRGDLDASIENLGAAVQRGFRDLEWILLDRDLVAVRADPRFDAIRRELEGSRDPKDADPEAPEPEGIDGGGRDTGDR